MRLISLDHLVLTVADIDATVDFYTRVLGMQRVEFGDRRVALTFGNSKINLHEVMSGLAALGVPIEEGPVSRTGALGPITSC